jgi:hypothetical protein
MAEDYRFRPARRDYQKAAPIQYFKTHFRTGFLARGETDFGAA